MVLFKTNSISSFLIVVFLITSLISIVGHLQLRPWPASLPLDLLLVDDIAAKIRTDPEAVTAVSIDFGHINKAVPAAVLYPSSPADIASLIRFSYNSPRPFPVAARGHGHSNRGQASAPNGVVVDMASLGRGGKASRINVSSTGEPFTYVDAGGEQLWIDVLHATLEHGLAPRSWTDYLYLTVGGTLSNAGISGQAFRHGPQISNVYEVEVITGTGETVTCSKDKNSELYYGVLGGLGQFSIITRARIALEPAPRKVRWVRLIYTDSNLFTRDQELLISKEEEKGSRVFDYVEGSLMADSGGLIGSWRSSFFSWRDADMIFGLAARHGEVYCLEGAMYYGYGGEDQITAGDEIDQELERLLADLSFVPGFVFTNDVSYEQFLDRVHDGELKLRSAGLWDVPHPWLNIFVPKSRILDFDAGVFKGILKHNKSMGPILVYPMKKSKWDERMSAVVPNEEIFYTIGLLRSAVMDDLEHLENQNAEILEFCKQEGIEIKQYLPHHGTRIDWIRHFGPKWDTFVEMKRKYDPKALLSPGQRIFMRSPDVDHAAE